MAALEHLKRENEKLRRLVDELDQRVEDAERVMWKLERLVYEPQPLSGTIAVLKSCDLYKENYKRKHILRTPNEEGGDGGDG